MPLNVLWFRHGLRLHDNASLHEAASRSSCDSHKLLPVFIFDGETAGTNHCGFNRFQYLLECLKDLDEQFRKAGSKLHVFRGSPVEVFSALHAKFGISSLCFEQDCEPVWQARDEKVQEWCNDKNIEWIEKIGHTLWNPKEILEVNGGSPPLTFSMFNHVVQSLGPPERPLPDKDLDTVKMANIPAEDIKLLLDEFPTPADFGVSSEELGDCAKVYVGGEKSALEHLKVRLEVEAKAFNAGSYLPNQRNPDILCPPKSLSPDLRFGAISVRRFYWGLMDAFKASQKGSNKPFNPQIVSQLIWREFFYTMSVNNEFYDRMEMNEICINIPWYPTADNAQWKAFEQAKTGFPFIDAGMRQLYKEGWIHHIVRNALACFLTRGDLWISWEAGLRIFLKYLLDADWSVCAGNWMWVSSSAFEQVLNCSTCIDPCVYGRRADPWGEYIKRYVPELSQYPVEHIYEPWNAPLEVQKKAGCIVGKDYPARILEHNKTAKENIKKMEELKANLMKQLTQSKAPEHCAPSDEKEARTFMKFEDSCSGHDSDCCDTHSIRRGVEQRC